MSKKPIGLYFVTLTDYGADCPADFCECAKLFFMTLEECLGSIEKQQNGNDHLHVMFKGDGLPQKWRRKIKKAVYNKSQRESIPPNAMKLEKVTSTPKLVNYIIKELEDNENPYILTGYSTTWIQEQAEMAFKATKVFTKWISIKIDQVPGMLSTYTLKHDIRINNKSDFIQLITRIQMEGYNIRLWAKHMSWIYQAYKSLEGDQTQTIHYLENLLRFD